MSINTFSLRNKHYEVLRIMSTLLTLVLDYSFFRKQGIAFKTTSNNKDITQ